MCACESPKKTQNKNCQLHCALAIVHTANVVRLSYAHETHLFHHRKIHDLRLCRRLRSFAVRFSRSHRVLSQVTTTATRSCHAHHAAHSHTRSALNMTMMSISYCLRLDNNNNVFPILFCYLFSLTRYSKFDNMSQTEL